MKLKKHLLTYYVTSFQPIIKDPLDQVKLPFGLDLLFLLSHHGDQAFPKKKEQTIITVFRVCTSVYKY